MFRILLFHLEEDNSKYNINVKVSKVPMGIQHHTIYGIAGMPAYTYI